jgi:hypothetical protein
MTQTELLDRVDAKPKRKPSRKPTTIPWAKYLADPRINISSLKAMAKSPLQYRYNLDHPREDTTSMAFGRAVHCAVFEPDRFLSQHVAWRGGRRSGGDWDRFVAEHAGRIVLTADEFDKCLSMRSAVRENRLIKPYLKSGSAEVTIFWTEPVTGLRCKSRLDWLSSHPAIVDLKTTRDMSRFFNDAARLLYHYQAAFYVDAVNAEFGHPPPFVIAAIESEPPFDFALFPVTGDVLDVGRREYLRLLDRVKFHESINTWPGAYDSEQELLLPQWALGADSDDIDLTMGGESIAI